MPNPLTYSHNATVAAITAYYELVARAHWTDSKILRPPPDGWPQITRERFASAGFNDTVIELLRHIPNFSNPDGMWIIPAVAAANYIDEEIYPRFLQESQRTREWPHQQRSLPPHVVLIATNAEEQEYGYNVLLDTNCGVVIMEISDGEMGRCFEESMDVDGEVYWSTVDFGTSDRIGLWRVETFFKFCKEQLYFSHWMPVMEGGGGCLTDGHQEWRGHRERIMREAGWPGDANGEWDKEKARKEMKVCLGGFDDASSSENEDCLW